jgi:hypothetical protein
MQKRRAAVLSLLLTLAASSAAAQVADHLECYNIKDSAAKASYVADLHGLAVEPGCEIKVPAKLLCVDTTKTNVQPASPIDGEGTEQSRVLCYKIKCPKQEPPTVQWTDQFGTRPLTVKGSKYVCAPDLAPESPAFHYIFVTSATFDGNLSGLSGADAKCQANAQSAALPGTYSALLSGTGVNAADRFGDFELRLTDGVTVVANNKADLFDGSLDAAISMDASGNSVLQSGTQTVWTATLSDGTYYGENCNNSSSLADWSTTSARTLAGLASSTTSGWITGAGVQPCAGLNRLYCIQQ